MARCPWLVLIFLTLPFPHTLWGIQDRPRTDDRLQEIRELQKAGRDSQAENLAWALLDHVDAHEGKRSEAAAETLDLLARALYRNGKRRQAKTLDIAERAVELRRSLNGRDSLEYAASVHQLGQLIHSSSDFARTQSLFEEALEIRRRRVGEEHPLVADCWQSLGLVHADVGRIETGRNFLNRALAIREKMGPHQELATVIKNLAGLNYQEGNYPAALSKYRRSLELSEELLDPGHPLLGKALHNVGVAHHVNGDINEAFDHYERALETYEVTRGANHPLIATTHSALAMLYQDTGDFTSARRHFESAKQGIAQGFGRDHPRYAILLSELGILLELSGEYEEAEQLQREALGIRRNAFDLPHGDIGQSYSRLGNLALRQGRNDEAKRYLEKAFEIQENSLDSTHPDFAPTLMGLANIAESRGDLENARHYLQRAIRISGQDRPDHPMLAEPLGQLAKISGQPDEALSINNRALEILDGTFGPGHPRTADLLENRARLLTQAKHYEDALTDSLRAASVTRNHIRETILAMAERRALEFSARQGTARDLVLTLLSRHLPDVDHVIAAWDEVIRSRALVLDAVVARNQILHASTNSVLARQANKLAEERLRLSNMWVRRRNDLSPERQARLIREAQSRVDHLEQNLADQSEPLLRIREGRQVGFSQVKQALPQNTALIAIVLYREEELGNRYLAFILSSKEALPQVVDLGPASRLNSLVERWRGLLNQAFDPNEEIAAVSEERLRVVGWSLRRSLWDPIATKLGEEVRQILFVPDGSLHLIQPTALPAPGDRYLIEAGFRVHLLTAERDLVELAKPATLGRGVLAIGGPAFNDRSSFAALDQQESSKSLTLGSILDTALSFIGRGWTTCVPFEKRYFSPLPESTQEVEAIRSLIPQDSMPIRKLTGSLASEKRVKQQVSGHRILHFATHGFFIDKECSPTNSKTRGLSGPSTSRTLTTGSLGHSGLALAGANFRQAATRYEEDGILTAEEIAGLNLQGVEWAVLSACETGVGEVLNGEGVLGLQRAFTTAGARTVIMSLWSVDDKSTQQWMRELYRARFRNKLNAIESVQRASLTVLADRRAEGLSSHPAYWAGFVASGDWH